MSALTDSRMTGDVAGFATDAIGRLRKKMGWSVEKAAAALMVFTIGYLHGAIGHAATNALAQQALALRGPGWKP